MRERVRVGAGGGGGAAAAERRARSSRVCVAVPAHEIARAAARDGDRANRL